MPIRMTESQRRAYLELGGARWVKRLMDYDIAQRRLKGEDI